MVSKYKKSIYYYLLIAFIIMRFIWLVLVEPTGAATSVRLHPNMNTMVGRAASTLPYIVYTSIFLLAIILVGTILKKYWAYISAFAFGVIHLILVISIVVVGGNPRVDGPIYVMAACTGIIVFSVLTIKTLREKVKFQEAITTELT